VVSLMAGRSQLLSISAVGRSQAYRPFTAILLERPDQDLYNVSNKPTARLIELRSAMNSDIVLERLLQDISENAIRSLVAEVAVGYDVARYVVDLLLEEASV